MRRTSCLPQSPEDSGNSSNESFSLCYTDSSNSPNNSPVIQPPNSPKTRSEIINSNKRFFRGILSPEKREIVDKTEQLEVHLKTVYSGIVPVLCLPSINKKKDTYRLECILNSNSKEYHIKIIDYNANNLSERYVYPVDQLMRLPAIEINEAEFNTNTDILFAIIQYIKMLTDNNIEFKLCDIVAISGINISNCYWNGYYLNIGSGNHSPRKSTLIKPLCSVDIISHEMTHGLIQEICDLEYKWHSGALNESISDIFGVCCEFYVFKNVFLNKSLYISDSTVSWDIGTHVKLNGMRSMSDPWIHHQPKKINDMYYQRYDNPNDYHGVHQNSGIFNYYFYRLCSIRPIFEAMCIIIDALRISYKRTTLQEFHALLPFFNIEIE